jgi:hypothetical protein
LGFDDFTVEGTTSDGTSSAAYLQARRAYSVGDTEDFRVLVSSTGNYLQTNTGAWTVTIVAGSITPDLVDVDALLQSARAQQDYETFENVWSQQGVLNVGKRTFLGAVRKALEGQPTYAPYEVMRRLLVAEADFNVSASLSRQVAVDLLAGEVADQATAPDLLSAL